MLSQSPQPGATVGGKYLIVRLLGQGGMGAVYEAENVFTKRRVAIKWLGTPGGQGADRRDRLLREAQAAARVKHRNVVDVYDVGFEQSAVFLVMELLSGETLATAMERRTQPIPAFLALLVAAMRGVAEAHRQGVIHRDVKPENIFLAREVDHPDPIPKLLDFGVAKLQDVRALTRTGHAIGTPLFMPVEQLRGARDLDARVDVYGFGVILYIALTGHPPYWGATLPDLALRVATTDAPPARSLREELPEPLSEVLSAAVARERDQRTPSMDALIAGLLPFTTDAGYLAHAPSVADTILARIEFPDDSSAEVESVASESGGIPSTRPLATPIAPHTPTPIPRDMPREPAPSATETRNLWLRRALVPGVAVVAALVAVAVQSLPSRERSRAAEGEHIAPVPAPLPSGSPSRAAPTPNVVAPLPVANDAALSVPPDPARVREHSEAASEPVVSAPSADAGTRSASEPSRRSRRSRASRAGDERATQAVPPPQMIEPETKPAPKPGARPARKTGFTVDEFLGGK